MRYHTEQFDIAVGNSKVRNRTCAALLVIFSTCIAAGVWGGLNWEGRRLDGARAGVATSAGLRQAGFKPGARRLIYPVRAQFYPALPGPWPRRPVPYLRSRLFPM